MDANGTSKVDLHMHSTFSDGTDTPEALVQTARAAGISIFAVTDHDTADGSEALSKVDLPAGLACVPGIEFSCRMRAGKCHLLGYGFDVEAPAMREAIRMGRTRRREKLERRLAFLDACGMPLSEAEKESLRSLPGAGKPHLANLLIRHGYARSREEAITGIINRCPEENTRIEAETAVVAILEAGGIPVWAHPFGETGEAPLSEEKLLAYLAELMSYGLLGMECYYAAYELDRCHYLSVLARRRGLLVSGGSDYHGTNKRIAPGTLNADHVPVPPDELTVLPALKKYLQSPVGCDRV